MPAIPLIASTRNAGKIREIREVLGNRFQVHDLTSLPHLPEVEETGATFHENAALKALAASALSDSWVIADDSGLEVDFLGGAPGVHSARFAGAGADDSKNIALLLEKLRGVPSRLRSARFRCVIALAHHGKIVESFSGAVEGRIAGSARGEGGFGYDPVFIPDGWSKTFAQGTADEKHAISHRARALTALAHWPHWTAP